MSKLSKQEKLELTKEHVAGGITKAAALAELVGVKERTMVGYLRELGVRRSHPCAASAGERREFILANWDKPARWLAREAGVSRNTVYGDIRAIEEETGKVYELVVTGRPRGSMNRYTTTTLTASESKIYQHAAKAHNLFLMASGVRA